MSSGRDTRETSISPDPSGSRAIPASSAASTRALAPATAAHPLPLPLPWDRFRRSSCISSLTSSRRTIPAVPSRENTEITRK